MKKLTRVAYASRPVLTPPIPTTGRGFGVIFAAGPGGGVALHVVENSPAFASGIAVGDQVIAINGIAAGDTGADALKHMNDAETATFVLRRPNGGIYSVNIRKAEWSGLNAPKR